LVYAAVVAKRAKPRHFQGALDELRIYNRALTEREVAGLVQLEQPIRGMKTTPGMPSELLFPNSNFALGKLKGWQVVHNIHGVKDWDDRPDGSGYVEILKDIKADGGYVADAKEIVSGVTLFSPPIKVTVSNRILLARYCNPFGVSSCQLVALTEEKNQVKLEKNHETNLAEHRHDLKRWLGKTIRVGFSGSWIRVDYLRTLPTR
jgi:hypothetical protein